MDLLDILIYLGRKGAISRHITITTSRMGSDLGISQQSVSRWLITLEKDRIIKRQEGIRGYLVKITPAGKTLMLEKRNELDGVLKGGERIIMKGRVVSGMKEGRYYIGQKVYEERIQSKFGFRPFHGTLNVRLTTMDDMEFKEKLNAMKGIDIKGFKKGGRTFGSIKCFPCKLDGADCAAIIPERSHYGLDVIEIISPHNLREKLNLSDGDNVKVDVNTGEEGVTE